MTPRGRTGPVVCLLPARNAAGHLDEWLASVQGFADAVVALDDGSEDDTGDRLRRSPLVARVLANPRRRGYTGWDDAANRARLLEAAGGLAPAWIMQLDADERMTADDAAALRRFLLNDADPDLAYGFSVVRMVGDREHYDAGHEQWVCRCFAHDPTHRFPTDRLHFVAVPTAFPPPRRVRTTFRIQHLVGLTADDRRAQYLKYRQADPDHEHQPSYAHLLREPELVQRWAPRSGALHPIAGAPGRQDPPPGPELSVVVTGGGGRGPAGAARVTETGQAARAVAPPDVIEVLAVVAHDDRAAVDAAVAVGARVVPVDPGATAAIARTAGFRVATGRFLAAPSGIVGADSLRARLEAHRAGWALVSGTWRPGGLDPSATAAMVLAHWHQLVGAPPGPGTVAPLECSHHRDAWSEVDLDDDVGRHRLLVQRGYGTALVPEAVTTLDRGPVRGPTALLTWSFRRGRAHGAETVRAGSGRLDGRALLRATVAGVVPARRVLHAARRAHAHGAGLAHPGTVLALAAGAAATWAGGLYGLLRSPRSPRAARNPPTC